MLRRDAARAQWCGASGDCVAAPFVVDHRFVAATDTPSQQEDHALPVSAFYAYGQASVHWIDFRGSPLLAGSTFIHTDTSYQYRRMLVRYRASAIVTATESPAWPSALGAVPYRGTGRAYGDVDFMAAATLHGHSLHLFYSLPAPNQTVTVLSSPRSPPQ